MSERCSLRDYLIETYSVDVNSPIEAAMLQQTINFISSGMVKQAFLDEREAVFTLVKETIAKKY